MSPGQTLDPFGSSMRTLSTQVMQWLVAYRAGEELAGERRDKQAAPDLRGAALLETGSKDLSDFGNAVLDRWQELAVPSGFDGELVLAIALIEEALQHRVEQYLERLAFWWDIRRLYDVDELLADAQVLLLLPYLNQTRADFNPWAALFGARLPIEGPIDWAGLKQAVTKPDQDTDAALDALEKRTEGERPYKPRVVFCRAMELIFTSRFEEEHIPIAIEELTLPVRK